MNIICGLPMINPKVSNNPLVDPVRRLAAWEQTAGYFKEHKKRG